MNGWLIFIAHELTLFAAIGFLIGGINDLIIDIIWMGRSLWRRFFIYRHHQRADIQSLAEPRSPGPIVVFVAAWDESDVVGQMLDYAVDHYRHDDYRIYVGCYPNDPATISAIKSVSSPRIRLVVGSDPGPTTKADCLNNLWRALVADERAEGVEAKAIVLHDAEDIVHSAELRVFDTLIERFDLVQLPVVPLIDARSRWIGGHYNDEFAEAHAKTLVVREALGAAIPAAGVGCAFSRGLMARIADERDGEPFDRDSLTEDYEIGLRMAAYGGRGAFVRLPGEDRSAMVGVRAHFPATLAAAVRQKSRWITGIALAGWDRLGWDRGFAECWMRIYDRQAMLSAVVLVAGYFSLLLCSGLWVAHQILGTRMFVPEVGLSLTLSICGALLWWRLLVRAFFVARAYGWREGMRAIPRAVIGNIIAIMAARRALWMYIRMRHDGVVRWDKTRHSFPQALPAE